MNDIDDNLSVSDIKLSVSDIKLSVGDSKLSVIHDQERQFARELASRVIFKPELSAWMILIPVFFLYYFWRLQQYSNNSRTFVEQWMLPRRQTLDEAGTALEEGREADFAHVIPEDRIPPGALAPYKKWIGALHHYYTDLLRAEGDDYKQLARHAHGDKTTHLLVLNHLHQWEKKLNAALQPHLEASDPEVGEVIRRIETCCESLRREEANRIF